MRGHGIDNRILLSLCSTLRNGTQYQVCHIDGLDVEEDVKLFVGQFVSKGLGKETILQIVMLGGRMVLDGTITTMVVGEHEAIIADHHTRAETAKLHNGIVQRRCLCTVQFFRSQL